MIEQFAAALRAEMRTDVESHSERILAGKCATFDEYRYAVGVLRGLTLAENRLQSLLERVENANDD